MKSSDILPRCLRAKIRHGKGCAEYFANTTSFHCPDNDFAVGNKGRVNNPGELSSGNTRFKYYESCWRDEFKSASQIAAGPRQA